MLERSPGHLQAQESLAGVLLEADAIDEAIVRYGAVLAADPESVRARTELLRAHALLGEWDRVARLFAADGTDNPGRMMVWARLRLWHPPLPAARPPPPPPPEIYHLPFRAVALLTEIHDGTADPAQIVRIALHAPNSEAGRLKTARLQMATEAAAFVGRSDRALEFLSWATGSGLADLAWMERCPALAPLRSDLRWPVERAIVADRAARLLAAARG